MTATTEALLKAFQSVYEANSQRIEAICRHYMRRTADADDVLQRVWLLGWRALLRGYPARDWSSVIAAIAWRECASAARRKPIAWSAMPDDLPSREIPPDVLAAQEDELAAIDRAMARLPDEDQLILEMLHNGLAIVEIAKQLNVCGRTIRRRIEGIQSRLNCLLRS